MEFLNFVHQAKAECARCGHKPQDGTLCECPCGLAFYCDGQCQAEHWPMHKKDCSKGRKGRVLMSKCAACGAPSTSLMSCRCEAILYCSVACQREHYPIHRRTCTVAVMTFKRRTHQLTRLAPTGQGLGSAGPVPPLQPQEPERPSAAVQTDDSCAALIREARGAEAAEAPDGDPAGLDAIGKVLSTASVDGPGPDGLTSNGAAPPPSEALTNGHGTGSGPPNPLAAPPGADAAV